MSPPTAVVETDPARGRRGTIRGRLVRTLALPLVAIAVLLTVVVVNDSKAFSTANQTRRAVDILLETGTLVDRLQVERGVVAGLLGGDVSFRGELDRVRAQVDEERALLRGLATDAQAATVLTALDGLADLNDIRSRVDSNGIERSVAFEYYTTRIAALSAIDIGVDRSTDEQLRRAVASLQALDALKEATAQERAFLTSVYAAGGFEGDEYQTFAAMNARQQAAIESYHRYANPRQWQLVEEALDTGAAREAAFFEERAVAAVNAPFVVSPQSWWSAHTTILDDLRSAQLTVGGDVAGRASFLQNYATVRLASLVVLALLSTVGGALLMIASARSITLPLAMLAAEARAVAIERLPLSVERAQMSAPDRAPEPPPRVAVPRRSSAEVAAVAEALDSAQATAYVLATEQARLRLSTSESLANLGRRNQNLLRRQLGFISRLEREETDPSGLANLFELDHLATRMRRNAESLLVLVGESTPRTWTEPVAVADVLRAAISEVEDYRRVTMRRVDDAYVGGAAVAGVAHMLAELLENGLSFSPPDTDVEIQGRAMPGRYLIGITDQGLGMDAEDMQRANARLRGEESFLTAPTRYLGHYVVGHLARQFGVDVQLAPSPVTGVTARVVLPAALLAMPTALHGGAPVAASLATRALGAAQPPSVEYPTVMGQPVSADAGRATVPLAGQGAWFTPSHEAGPMATPAGPTVGAATGAPMWPPPPSRDGFATEVAHGRGERTRNGLLRRVPGPRRPVPAEAEPAHEPATAADIRDHLGALRRGVARGAQEHASAGQPAQPYPYPSQWEPDSERSARGG